MKNGWYKGRRALTTKTVWHRFRCAMDRLWRKFRCAANWHGLMDAPEYQIGIRKRHNFHFTCRHCRKDFKL